MDYVILVRNPSTGHVFAIDENEDHIATWPTKADAEAFAATNSLTHMWPYSIVEAPDDQR